MICGWTTADHAFILSVKLTHQGQWVGLDVTTQLSVSTFFWLPAMNLKFSLDLWAWCDWTTFSDSMTWPQSKHCLPAVVLLIVPCTVFCTVGYGIDDFIYSIQMFVTLCLLVSNLSFNWQGRMRVSAVSRALPGVCLNRISLSRNHWILGGSSVSACQPHFRSVSMTKCFPIRKTRKHSQPHVNSSASFSTWAYLCSVCLSVSVMRTRLVSTASPLSVGGLYWISMKRHLHHGFRSLLGSSSVRWRWCEIISQPIKCFLFSTSAGQLIIFREKVSQRLIYFSNTRNVFSQLM